MSSAFEDIRHCMEQEEYARLLDCMGKLQFQKRNPDRNMYYSSYLSTYVERDVRDISGTVNALKFNRFITAVAARTSQLLNYQALAEDAEIDIQTSKAWVNILETLGIIFLLHPYSNNVLKRTIKTPKVYFYDTGLVCYLTKWSSPEVDRKSVV